MTLSRKDDAISVFEAISPCDLLADQVHLSINAILGFKKKLMGLIGDVTDDRHLPAGHAWDCVFAVYLFWCDKLRTPLDEAVIVLEQGGPYDFFFKDQATRREKSIQVETPLSNCRNCCMPVAADATVDVVTLVPILRFP